MGVTRALLLVCALSACRSAGTEPGDQNLSGEYEWIGSSGGIAGRTLTPASEGYRVRFRFSGNQVTVFRNDSARGTAIVTVRGDEVTYQPAISVFTFDPSIDTQTFADLPGDTIALRDPCCDRFDHHFIER